MAGSPHVPGSGTSEPLEQGFNSGDSSRVGQNQSVKELSLEVSLRLGHAQTLDAIAISRPESFDHYSEPLGPLSIPEGYGHRPAIIGGLCMT